MAGWDTWKNLVEYEFTQSQEEGRDPQTVESLRPEFLAAGDDEQKLLAVWDKLLALPVRKDFSFNEPSDLPTIRSLRPPHKPITPSPHFPDSALLDRLHGAWLGRCAGCALGKPVEVFMGATDDGIASKERIKQYLLAVSPKEYPLNYYFPQHSPAEKKVGKTICPASTREHIAFMGTDDDIRYTVIGQLVMREKGKTFTTWDVANAWMEHLPYRNVCTAETQAYRNLVTRYNLHVNAARDADVDWHWVATHRNPYREWIGAQIRADSWGYAAAGNPALAAEFAWRDARLSHTKNGIYGEMFCAAMIAAAFVLDDPLQIVESGLAEIPKTSRLYAEMQQAISICQKYSDGGIGVPPVQSKRKSSGGTPLPPFAFEKVLDEIYALLGHYHPVHTNNNAALVVAALLLGGHDFEKVITIAVMGGWDSDCNGATAGSIAGAMLGAKQLPRKWIDPLHDTLNAELPGYHPIAISECARRSAEIVRRVCP